MFFLSTYVFSQAQIEFEPTSVLESGTWYKAKISGTGIYKITFQKLNDLGFDSPESLRIYSNKGEQLSYEVDTTAYNDLVELPLYQGDGFYVFYAEGAGGWGFNPEDSTFKYNTHDYALSNYIFLTTSFGAGEKIQERDFSSLPTNLNVTSYSWRNYYEEEIYNLAQSGRTWFGKKFENGEFSYDFNAQNYIPGSDYKIEISTAARSEFGGTFHYYLNDNKFAQRSFVNVIMNSHEGKIAIAKTVNANINNAQEENTFRASFVSSGTNDESYMDYVFVNTRCKLSYTSSPFFFRDIDSYIMGGNGLFQLEDMETGVQVWNISNPGEVYILKGNLNGSRYEFKSPVDQLNEFVALNPSTSYPAPIYNDDDNNDVGWLAENQNLHALSSPELLIVTHPLFLEPADSLANIHRVMDGMDVVVVTTDQIYNEFSSGKKDASAIRNFARMLWLKSPETFKYLLLFGDGTYDNRNQDENNMNYIPTYESLESLHQTQTFTADDIYGQLETGEFSVSGTLDIGVGRLPVNWSDSEENTVSWGVIKKINQYYSQEVKRDWRNRMIFLADDMEQTWERDFVYGSEDLIEIVKNEAPEINFTKIYMDAFTSISSSTSQMFGQKQTLGGLLSNERGENQAAGRGSQEIERPGESPPP